MGLIEIRASHIEQKRKIVLSADLFYLAFFFSAGDRNRNTEIDLHCLYVRLIVNLQRIKCIKWN